MLLGKIQKVDRPVPSDSKQHRPGPAQPRGTRTLPKFWQKLRGAPGVLFTQTCRPCSMQLELNIPGNTWS